MEKEELLECPECGSQEVTVSHLQRFMANTGDHYCHSVKTHDANSEATCLACQWIGRRDQLKAHNARVEGPGEAAQRADFDRSARTTGYASGDRDGDS